MTVYALCFTWVALILGAIWVVFAHGLAALLFWGFIVLAVAATFIALFSKT